MHNSIIGVDIGALTVNAVILDPSGDTVNSAYCFHQGNPLTTLRRLLEGMTNGTPAGIAVTGSGAKICLTRDVMLVDEVQAATAAVRALLPNARNILDIGGASLTLIRLNSVGLFRSFSSNSQCAAGTGSFLDEQAMRLGLTYGDIAQLDGVDEPPSVATRCAVFAKSDLIHLQQAGATAQEMWSGLCRGMAQTALQTLLKGKPLAGLTALVGGVAQNREVLRWLRQLADSELVTHADAHMSGALGAALLAHTSGRLTPIHWHEWLEKADDGTAMHVRAPVAQCNTSEGEPSGFASEHADEPLALVRTQYPSFEVLESYSDTADNEVRISRWPNNAVVRGFLGIDIGSTSTKLCFIDEDGDVLVDIYRKTAGDPVGATKQLFAAMLALANARHAQFEIIASGTTGSGRKLVGAVIGADTIANEISAHVAGATHVDPQLETIFEIGGQDSKYMRTHAGAVVDANMNYVCAAGTGSFVEEQARKLGVPLDEVGDQVLGLVPPQTSDRCTVFMEQDVNRLLRHGNNASMALAAVMRSVVQNYLNKVVGNRPYSRAKIGFQGATARNKGLVAAFETLLGVEMVVSPYCHVMGAWGVALLAREHLRIGGETSRFIGLDLSGRHVELRKERCKLCNNDCEITFANIEGCDEEPSWGYVCGRDAADEKMRVHREHSLFRKRQRWLWGDGAATRVPKNDHRQPLVVLPRALTTFSHLPMWRRLLEELGAEITLTAESTRQTRERGAALTSADFCFPVKLAHGQVAEALETDADFVFIPRMVAQPPAGNQSNTYLCPYVQAFPSVIDAAISQIGGNTSKLLMPTFDRRQSLHRQVKSLHTALGPALGVTEIQVRQALEAAIAVQDAFERRCQDAGRDVLRALAASAKTSKPGIVIIGRPYNVGDASVNLELPRKIAEMGYQVIPIDFVPYEPIDIHPRYHNVFWAYGQRILATLETVRNRDDLFAIYFTNFNCGPDSFLLSYAEEIMGDKPMLALELDEHGADAGYITRIEAFLDVTRSWNSSPAPSIAALPQCSEDELRDRHIWVPAMHPIGSKMFAAGFRAAGYDSDALPTETHADLALGQRHTRGCECLPVRTMVGSLINALERDPSGKKQAVFMPTGKGPCRFGQYSALHRMILERTGHEDTMILAPSSDNNYFGLSEGLRRTMWKALLTGDAIFRSACRVRPYERTPGDTDQALASWTDLAAKTVEERGDLLDLVERAGRAFLRIPTRNERKPLVGVVGEIYVRNNVFCNEDVVHVIERAGGEAWVTPLTEWMLFTGAEDARNFVDLPKSIGEAVTQGKRIIKSRWMKNNDATFHKAVGAILADRHEPDIDDTVIAGRRYLPFNIGGEAILTLGRSVHFAQQGASLIVNISPFGCMAGTICAALFTKMERELQVSVINMFYDGSGDENSRLEVFLANLEPSAARSGPPRDRSQKVGNKSPFAFFRM
ncbi:MAG: hypothetical protein A2289_20190 [Deltaproteobacteria bacterium RIFOXYA12_FULL_58_15]|nr:MAG: hypothetical protein A2289_20190 [Deltaproteobacteria bacterium RIFOXYA12_FULL_58_15]